MNDVVFVACGGGARAVVRDAGARLDVPAVIISSSEVSGIELKDLPGSDHWTYDEAYGLIGSNREAIGKLLQGCRVLIVFGMLGGGTATGTMKALSECARSCGCKVVSVVNVPLSVEDRRSVAMEQLPGIADSSDRVFIMDGDVMFRIADIEARNALPLMARTIAFMVSNIRESMEGPFFSTFSQKIYTFALVSDMDPATAVERSLEATMFKTDPLDGKLIVMVGSGYDLALREQVMDAVVSANGIMPEVINRRDPEDTKVLVFASVKDLRVRSLILLPGFPVLYELSSVPKHAHDRVVLVLRGDRAAHHAPEHDRGGGPPTRGILHRIQQIAEEVEHHGLLLGISRFGLLGDVLDHEELVHGDGGGVGEVHDRIFGAGGDVDQDVAGVDLVLQQTDVLPAEDQCDLLGVSPASEGELANRDRDTGEVAVAACGDPACPCYKEASVHRLVEGIDDDSVVQDVGSMLGPPVRIVPQLARADEIELAQAEVGHGSGDGSHVPLVFRADYDYAYLRHRYAVRSLCL